MPTWVYISAGMPRIVTADITEAINEIVSGKELRFLPPNKNCPMEDFL